MRGVVPNRSVCLPNDGPGVSDRSLPFEMAVSRASITAEIATLAVNPGSSNDGNARRAPVASIRLSAYLRPCARAR